MKFHSPQHAPSPTRPSFPTRNNARTPANLPTLRCYSVLMPFSFPETQPWDRVSRFSGIAWLLAYTLFLLHAFRDTSGFLFPDLVNLMIHEAGHPAFSWGGHTLMLLGGTLGELLVPLLCAAAFFYKGQTLGFTFSSFWFFENFLYIGTYMKDARDNALPLVNSDIGDWTLLFSQWGLLDSDLKIGGFTRFLGWLGMLATVAWLAWRTWRDSQPQAHPLNLSE